MAHSLRYVANFKLTALGSIRMIRRPVRGSRLTR